MGRVVGLSKVSPGIYRYGVDGRLYLRANRWWDAYESGDHVGRFSTASAATRALDARVAANAARRLPNR